MSIKNWDKFIKRVQNLHGIKDEDFLNFIRSRDYLNDTFFDVKLWWRAQKITQQIEKNKDHLTVISGLEGVGKSTLAVQLGAVTSPTLSLQNICYERHEFFNQLPGKPGDTFILDEGAMFLFSREGMKGGNIDTIKLLTLCRQYRLNLILCIPNFNDVDPYVRSHRVSTFIYLSDMHGNYYGYGRSAIAKISDLMRKGYKNPAQWRKLPTGSFWTGRHNKNFPVLNDISWERYSELKSAHMDGFLKELREKYSEHLGEFVTVKEYRRVFPVSNQTVYRSLEEGKLKGKKIRGKWLVAKSEIDDELSKLENQDFPARAIG